MDQVINDTIFGNIDADFIISSTKKSLEKYPEGEMFLESIESENIILENRVIKSNQKIGKSGFGIRGILGKTSHYFTNSNITRSAIENTCNSLFSSSSMDKNIVQHKTPFVINQTHGIYTAENPLTSKSLKDKIDFLYKIEEKIKSKDKKVQSTKIALSGNFQIISVIDKKGNIVFDKRPLTRLSIFVVLKDSKGRLENAHYGGGGRFLYDNILNDNIIDEYVSKVLHSANELLKSKPAPAGKMNVLLGSGWPGILLHEAVGHGLEADFNRKGTSVFSNKIGSKVASKGVTVIDNGSIKDRRGSLNIDDEGIKTQKNILIEDGILKGYMYDKHNAMLMEKEPTGNGRRESYAHLPMPRMTNTYMESGTHDMESMLDKMQNGIYAKEFGGGQVDITSGQFVFDASSAYLVKNGKITDPIKGAVITGMGHEALKNIKMIGGKTELDSGIGTCGKDGQSVPVGVGMPKVLINDMTVGGSA